MRLPVRLLALNRRVPHTLAAGAFLDWSILTAELAARDQSWKIGKFVYDTLVRDPFGGGT